MKVLLLTCFLLTGAGCETDSLFVYGTIGGEALLPCLHLTPPDCAHVSWTFFFKGDGVRFSVEVETGQVKLDSDKSGRISVLSNCSLVLRDLRPSDAGSYVCLRDGNATANVYLSVLAITSPSTVTELQLGGNLSLTCRVYTYFDAGSCRSYSNEFNLSWTEGNGAELHDHDRYKLQSSDNRCKTTLTVTNLQVEDSDRRWRCSVRNLLNSQVKSLDFVTRLVFGAPPPDPDAGTTTSADGSAHSLPVSRILLCVALPVMVLTVGFFRSRRDTNKDSEAEIELQEQNK